MPHTWRDREGGRPIHAADCPCWRHDVAPEPLPQELVAPPARTPGVYVPPRRWWQWVLGL